MKYKLFNRFDKRATIPANAGTKTEPIYEMELDQNGHKVLKKTKRVTDTYSIIQESLEATKIENIIRRATEGDIEALQKMEGQFIDISEFPSNLMQAQNLVLKMEHQFNKLPLSIKQKFDMSPEKYIMQYGSNEWLDALGIKKAEPKTEPKTEKTTKAKKEVKAEVVDNEQKQ